MVSASELRPGMAIRVDSQIFRVLEVENKAGTAKMTGTVKARLSNLRSGRLWDQHFRPLERLEDVELEKRRLEYLYSDSNDCIFQRLDNFDQVSFPVDSLGLAPQLLQSGTEVQGEFFDGEAVSVDLPQSLEARIATTPPPTRSQPDSGTKEATLENGMTIQVPLFVAPGETVSVDVKTGRYVERVRPPHKKSA